jgi:hypothetical protein
MNITKSVLESTAASTDHEGRSAPGESGIAESVPP